jgi:hypothetical protein
MVDENLCMQREDGLLCCQGHSRVLLFSIRRISPLQNFLLDTHHERQAGTTDGQKFSFDIVSDEYVKKGKAISKMYFHVPFSEMWSDDTITAVLHQINYFNEAGWFANRNIAIKLCEKVEELFHIIQFQGANRHHAFRWQAIAS